MLLTLQGRPGSLRGNVIYQFSNRTGSFENARLTLVLDEVLTPLHDAVVALLVALADVTWHRKIGKAVSRLCYDAAGIPTSMHVPVMSQPSGVRSLVSILWYPSMTFGPRSHWSTSRRHFSIRSREPVS